MPYTFPARFTRTFAEFERQWETTEPTHSSPSLHVVGLNSARPYRHQGGALHDEPAPPRPERLEAAPDGRVPRRRAPPPHGRCAVARVAQAAGRRTGTACCASSSPPGADLILAGHIHQAAVSERHEFEVVSGDVRAAVDLDRARARAAAAEPARRGARAARLRGRRARRSPCTRTSGGATTGASPRDGCSRAGSAPSPSSRC